MKMSSHNNYYTSPASPPGPPPPPPPKSYSQDPSRTATPTVNPPAQQQYYSQQYQQQAPPPPPHPNQTQSPPPQQSFSPAPPGYPSNQSFYSQQEQYSSTSQPPPQNAPPYQQQQQQHSSLPSTFELPPSVKAHTTPDLSSILSNSELLASLAQQHPAYDESLKPLQAQITSNLGLAKQVSALEAQVKSLREQTGQLMLQHSSLQTQWRRKQSEMDEALAPWGPRAMYQRLVAGIGEQEAILGAVYESFLDGGSEGHEYYGDNGGKASEKEVTDWVKRIREGTTVLEKRREMRSRWDEGRVGGWR